jgi:hypothetical protein
MSKGNKHRGKKPKLRIPISTRAPKVERPKNVYIRKKFNLNNLGDKNDS